MGQFSKANVGLDFNALLFILQPCLQGDTHTSNMAFITKPFWFKINPGHWVK